MSSYSTPYCNVENQTRAKRRWRGSDKSRAVLYTYTSARLFPTVTVTVCHPQAAPRRQAMPPA